MKSLIRKKIARNQNPKLLNVGQRIRKLWRAVRLDQSLTSWFIRIVLAPLWPLF